MKAVVFEAPGGPEVLELREVEPPPLGPSDVRVEVRATALNRADLLQRRGLYNPPDHVRADILGLEYAGVVVERGAHARRFELGARVMGLVAGGAYAEQIVVHEREAIPSPSNLSDAHAAALPEAFLTAFDALHVQCALRTGERVLIYAVGSGVGTAAVQLASLIGAQSIGTSRTPDKLERATELGLDVALPWDDDVVDAVSELTDGRGVEVLLDMLGPGALSTSLEVLGRRGRMITIGLLTGLRGELHMGRVLRKNLRLFGSTLRDRPLEEKIALAQRVERELSPAFERGALRPVIDSVLSIEEVAEAHRRMEANDTFGKIVLTWSI